MSILFEILNIDGCLFHWTQKNNLCTSNQQTKISKVLKMPRKVGIVRKKVIKNIKTTTTDISRPSSSPSCVLSKIKSAHEKISKEKLPADYSFSPLIINDDLNMGDKSCGIFLQIFTHSLNMIVITIMVMWVVDMLLKTATLSPMWIFKYL